MGPNCENEINPITYDVFAVGYCQVCNQDLYLRYQPDDKFELCKMFQRKPQTVCDAQYGLGLAKWRPWNDKVEYLRADTEHYVWTQFQCLCDGTCRSTTKPSHIIVLIGSACMVLSGLIIVYLFYRRRPWKSYDIDTDKIVLRGKEAPLLVSKTVFCLSIMSIFMVDWINIILDTVYFNELVDRAHLEPDPELNQTWIDQRIIYGLVTPSHVYSGLGGIIILAVLKNLIVFVLISGTFNRKQTEYHQTLKQIMLAATSLLVEDAVSSFYQYFYFEIYNDVEVWKQRNMMEKTIMNEMFQSFNEAKKRTIWASLNFPLYFPIVKSVLLILTSCYSFYKLCRVFDRKRATHLCFLMFAFLTIIMNITRSTSNAISSTYMFQIDDDDFVQNFRPRNVNEKFLPVGNIFIPVKQTENRSVY